MVTEPLDLGRLLAALGGARRSERGARGVFAEQGGPQVILGVVLRLRGRLPGGRGEAQGGRVAGEVPSGLVPAGPAVRERLRRPASVAVLPAVLTLSSAKPWPASSS